MRIFNITGHALTGADKRFLAREYRRKRNRQRKTLVGVYGVEKGDAMWREIHKRQNTTLVQDHPGGREASANAAYARDGGGVVADGFVARKDHKAFTYPIVRI
jgi:hypothetical protein